MILSGPQWIGVSTNPPSQWISQGKLCFANRYFYLYQLLLTVVFSAAIMVQYIVKESKVDFVHPQALSHLPCAPFVCSTSKIGYRLSSNIHFVVTCL